MKTTLGNQAINTVASWQPYKGCVAGALFAIGTAFLFTHPAYAEKGPCDLRKELDEALKDVATKKANADKLKPPAKPAGDLKKLNDDLADAIRKRDELISKVNDAQSKLNQFEGAKQAGLANRDEIVQKLTDQIKELQTKLQVAQQAETWQNNTAQSDKDALEKKKKDIQDMWKTVFDRFPGLQGRNDAEKMTESRTNVNDPRFTGFMDAGIDRVKKEMKPYEDTIRRLDLIDNDTDRPKGLSRQESDERQQARDALTKILPRLKMEVERCRAEAKTTIYQGLVAQNSQLDAMVKQLNAPEASALALVSQIPALRQKRDQLVQQKTALEGLLTKEKQFRAAVDQAKNDLDSKNTVPTANRAVLDLEKALNEWEPKRKAWDDAVLEWDAAIKTRVAAATAYQNSLKATEAEMKAAVASANNDLANTDKVVKAESDRVQRDLERKAKTEADTVKSKFQAEIDQMKGMADTEFVKRETQKIIQRWTQEKARINKEKDADFQTKKKEKALNRVKVLEARKAALDKFNCGCFPDAIKVREALKVKIFELGGTTGASTAGVRLTRLPPTDFGELEIPRESTVSLRGQWKCSCGSTWTLTETGRTAAGNVTYAATAGNGDWSMSIGGEFNVKQQVLTMAGTESSKGNRVLVVLQYVPKRGRLEGQYKDLTDNKVTAEELWRE